MQDELDGEDESGAEGEGEEGEGEGEGEGEEGAQEGGATVEKELPLLLKVSGMGGERVELSAPAPALPCPALP